MTARNESHEPTLAQLMQNREDLRTAETTGLTVEQVKTLNRIEANADDAEITTRAHFRGVEVEWRDDGFFHYGTVTPSGEIVRGNVAGPVYAEPATPAVEPEHAALDLENGGSRMTREVRETFDRAALAHELAELEAAAAYGRAHPYAGVCGDDDARADRIEELQAELAEPEPVSSEVWAASVRLADEYGDR